MNTRIQSHGSILPSLAGLAYLSLDPKMYPTTLVKIGSKALPMIESNRVVTGSRAIFCSAW